MSFTWKNWSGSVHVQTNGILRPTSEAQLSECVARAKQLRVVGAGHSFAPLCATRGTLIDLSALEVPIEVQPDGTTAWVPAGMSISALTRALWKRGYSLANQGDVNPQSVGGALATGTHGTGASLGSLSTLARGFRLMLADGAVVECSEHVQPELFEAARLSLGLVGVALAVRIELMPAYRLQERVVKLPLEDVSERFAELAATHRHVEFFAFPYAQHAIVKTLDLTQDTRPARRPAPWEEPIFKLACDISARWPSATSGTQRALMSLVTPSTRFGPAYEIFPTERNVRFEEMEYEVPREAGFPTLQALITAIRARSLHVTFPFEFRWVAGDDIWLSPFNRGPCAAISVHQYAKLPWREVFEAVEPIFVAHGGRPHWGKRHNLTAHDVAAMYPMAERFWRVRDQVDPGGKFTNDYLLRLFGANSTAQQVAHA